MKKSIRLFLPLLLQFFFCGAQAEYSPTKPYPAHAHNDYLHERPLLDALEHGFRSIEADVFSQGDSLYVAHDRKDIRPGRTLRALYLEPLLQYFSAHENTIYHNGTPLILLVDIKDNGLDSYKLLNRILQESRDMLCQVSQNSYLLGSVMVVVSGNRPVEYMLEQKQRFAFVDGRINNLGGVYTPQLMPLISDRWTKHFSWKGKGDMPEKERAKLSQYVKQAHTKGQLIRFWATPDNAGEERDALWTALLEAGVDLINTDDLAGLREFFE